VTRARRLRLPRERVKKSGETIHAPAGAAGNTSGAVEDNDDDNHESEDRIHKTSLPQSKVQMSK
jgi:hypothetical protein